MNKLNIYIVTYHILWTFETLEISNNSTFKRLHLFYEGVNWYFKKLWSYLFVRETNENIEKRDHSIVKRVNLEYYLSNVTIKHLTHYNRHKINKYLSIDNSMTFLLELLRLILISVNHWWWLISCSSFDKLYETAILYYKSILLGTII